MSVDVNGDSVSVKDNGGLNETYVAIMDEIGKIDKTVFDNFTVLGVDVLDQEDKFKEALESEGVTYPQIYVPGGSWIDGPLYLYGIRGIPQIILFAPDGTIVKRNLRGEEMKTFVAEQLKK